MEIEVSKAFTRLISAARAVSQEVGDAVQEILASGLKEPLAKEEARALLGRVVAVMRERAQLRGDSKTSAALSDEVDRFIENVLAQREQIGAVHRPTKAARAMLALQPHNGVEAYAVRPSPVFHEREVAVRQGFVRTRDIQLWDENER